MLWLSRNLALSLFKRSLIQDINHFAWKTCRGTWWFSFHDESFFVVFFHAQWVVFALELKTNFYQIAFASAKVWSFTIKIFIRWMKNYVKFMSVISHLSLSEPNKTFIVHTLLVVQGEKRERFWFIFKVMVAWWRELNSYVNSFTLQSIVK